MPDGQEEQAGRWLPLREAGPLLGLAPDSIRKRIRRGKWPADRCRQANDGAWTVFVPDMPDGAPTLSAAAVPDFRTDMPNLSGTVAELRARVEGLEGLVEAQRAHIADLRAELERRRWPGVKIWWRRFWEGDGEEKR